MPEKPKIIHFEDDKFLAAMYKNKFEQGGFTYLNYEYPPDDLEDFICREKPNLIVMDILMPKIDGYQATKRLKNDGRTKNIPILGLCNMGREEDIKEALDLGMVDYLVPAKQLPEKVVLRVKEILGLPVIPEPESKSVKPSDQSSWHGPSVQDQLNRGSAPLPLKKSLWKKLFG